MFPLVLITGEHQRTWTSEHQLVLLLVLFVHCCGHSLQNCANGYCISARSGMLWKKSNNLSVNFSPATAKLIIVHPHFTEFGSSFGVLQGDSSRFEFGASITAYYKFNVMANVSVENRLNLYSNYLDNPQNVDIDYQMNIFLKINKYLSANVAVQAIYDDNSVQAVQVREVFGLGVNYGF